MKMAGSMVLWFHTSAPREGLPGREIAMKYTLIAFVVILSGSSAALWQRNRALRQDLAEARSALAAMEGAPVVVASPAETRVVEVRVDAPAATPSPSPAPAATPATPAAIDETVLENAVRERMDAMRREREAERERWRRERENETEEQREARRQEFHARMQERATERLTEFVEKTGLNDAQCSALEGELTDLDGRVRELAESWASAIREGGSFGPEARLQFLGDMSAVVLDAYSALDAALPADWRENDGDFNPLHVIGSDALEPLVQAAMEAGTPGAMGVMGALMGGGMRGMRGPRGGGFPGGPGGPGSPGGPGGGAPRE